MGIISAGYGCECEVCPEVHLWNSCKDNLEARTENAWCGCSELQAWELTHNACPACDWSNEAVHEKQGMRTPCKTGDCDYVILNSYMIYFLIIYTLISHYHLVLILRYSRYIFFFGKRLLKNSVLFANTKDQLGININEDQTEWVYHLDFVYKRLLKH